MSTEFDGKKKLCCIHFGVMWNFYQEYDFKTNNASTNAVSLYVAFFLIIGPITMLTSIENKTPFLQL